jgi:hypothetical protein
MACRIDRRSFLKNSVAMGAAGAMIRGPVEAQLLAMLAHPSGEENLRGGVDSRVPKGRIGKVEISRLIAGGNIISGWCHQRDLLYVSTRSSSTRWR